MLERGVPIYCMILIILAERVQPGSDCASRGQHWSVVVVLCINNIAIVQCFYISSRCAMSDSIGSQEVVVPHCCPAVLRKLAKGAWNDWTLAANNIIVVMIQDDWRRRVTFVNAISAEQNINNHSEHNCNLLFKHYTSHSK